MVLGWGIVLGCRLRQLLATSNDHLRGQSRPLSMKPHLLSSNWMMAYTSFIELFGARGDVGEC